LAKREEAALVEVVREVGSERVEAAAERAMLTTDDEEWW
jgi:hypothetical protein